MQSRFSPKAESESSSICAHTEAYFSFPIIQVYEKKTLGLSLLSSTVERMLL